MVIKKPFQNEKTEWCWSGKGKRVCKDQERKIKTQLEQVALHQKRYLFPLRPEGKTKLGGCEGSFGRWSKNHLCQLIKRPSQYPMVKEEVLE